MNIDLSSFCLQSFFSISYTISLLKHLHFQRLISNIVTFFHWSCSFFWRKLCWQMHNYRKMCVYNGSLAKFLQCGVFFLHCFFSAFFFPPKILVVQQNATICLAARLKRMEYSLSMVYLGGDNIIALLCSYPVYSEL